MPSPELLKKIQEYIREHYCPADTAITCEAAAEYQAEQCVFQNTSLPGDQCEGAHAFGAAPAAASKSIDGAKALFSLNGSAIAGTEDLNKKLQHLDEGFAETLLRKIDESGMTDADCYHKAQLNRSHFNKIKNDPNYNIRKNTVLALILALSLGREDADEMLTKAGYALSPSSKTDLIIEYCIDHKIYDVTEVNQLLYAFDQELLGAGIRE